MTITTSAAKVAELKNIIKADSKAEIIVNLWDTYNRQRQGKIQEWQELRDYIFATDTSSTSNSQLPWKNSTTLPKLCQIRDNLHANYLSGLFPNDDWLRWEGYSAKDSTKKKAKTIEAYMQNKTREGGFRQTMSQLLYDFIDYGNAFATVSYEASFKETSDGEKIPDYIGPKAVRVSPLDIVFNPLASSFKDSFKVIRSIKTIGEVKLMAKNNPEFQFLPEALEKREHTSQMLGGYKAEDLEKAEAYSVDGFGSLQEYYGSGYVEFLEFYGDFHDPETGELHTNQVITVMDRKEVVRMGDFPSWLGHAPIYHVGWRLRPDNLWAMGPLDNLVGMQYRIDHLENLKADAMDLIVHPPLKIIGEVEDFEWGPEAEIHIDENGDVQEMGKSLQGVISASNDIRELEAKMELYAGAPREAMGVRTPGEKTAFEVQVLDNASSRIFQEKINSFEIGLLEPVLNGMLEKARRSADTLDIVRTLDDDLAIAEFLEVTRDDITAAGTLRPIGARHFSSQAQLLQNLLGVLNSPMGAKIDAHISSIQLAKTVEDVLKLSRFSLFKPNIKVFEDMETQRLISQAQEQLQAELEASAEEEDIL